MRLTIHAFGRELLDVQLSADPPSPGPDDDEPGDCTTYPVGFTATFDMPDEVGLPDRWA